MDGNRVQDIAARSLSSNEMPAEYIRSKHEQPALTTCDGDLQVPVIDLSTKDEKELVNAITNACCRWGLFQVTNHGIPSDAIEKFQEVGKKFFELPNEEKDLYAKEEGSIEGYGTKLQKEVEGKKGWVDHLFNKIAPPSAINYKFWPKNPPNYREATEEYTKHLQKVEDKLMRLMSLGLGLEAHELKEAVGGDKLEYMLKINYYPPCPRPDLALGVPEHTDMSALTILVPNEIQGLQVFNDENWYDVKYIPNALVIHVGDQSEIVGNGKYKAVLHRTTVTKEHTRMSWPVFMEPPKDLEVGPHPKLVSKENPAKYKSKKFGEYAYCKLNKIPQ